MILCDRYTMNVWPSPDYKTIHPPPNKQTNKKMTVWCKPLDTVKHNLHLRSTSQQSWLNVEIEVIEKVAIIFSPNVRLIGECSNCPWCCGIQMKDAATVNRRSIIGCTIDHKCPTRTVCGVVTIPSGNVVMLWLEWRNLPLSACSWSCRNKQ